MPLFGLGTRRRPAHIRPVSYSRGENGCIPGPVQSSIRGVAARIESTWSARPLRPRVRLRPVRPEVDAARGAREWFAPARSCGLLSAAVGVAATNMHAPARRVTVVSVGAVA